MKSLLVFALIAFGFTSHAGKLTAAQGPVANAGPDQTIYLSQTNTVTLNGSGSSGDSYQWTEVSTDYTSGATITSPNSAVTTVTGLPQGVFYFQLAVTSGGITATDEVAIIVDYDVPPGNSTLITHAIWADMAYGANLRDDTTSCYSWTSDIHSLVGTPPNQYFMEKDGTLGSKVDGMNQKYYSILNDGHGCGGYGRSEIIPNGSVDLIDTSKIYVIEWKGYFNQEMSGYAACGGCAIGVLMQCHAQDGNTPPFGFGLHGTDIQFSESSDGGNGSGQFDAAGNFKVKIFNTTDLTKSCHTLRFTIKEGLNNTGAFIKVEFDGVTKYYRNTGQVGATFMQDWLKGATFYDWSKLVIDPTNFTRGKSASLVTTSYKIYTMKASATPVPTIVTIPNQTITLPTNSVNLSGTASESGGSIASYNWTKSSGPSSGTISSPNSQSTSITNLVQGTYIFQLKVADNNGATATSNVQVTVNPSVQNALPTASAGSDQTVTLPTNTANLTGSGSDSDGTISSYLWSKTSGPSGGNISTPSAATTAISNLQQGEYTFQLKVTDNAGGTGTDTVHVSVIAAANQSPIANAGADQSIVLPVNTVNLIGKGTDNDGSIASYHWAKISGNAGTISSPDSSNTAITGLTQGSYGYELTVTDNQGATGKDTVLVSVKAGAIIIPTASAGADQTITLPTNSVTLKGSGVESNGTIVSYLWAKISGPSSFSISDSSSATPNVSGLVQGTYQFQLKVTDSNGVSAKDTVQITVNPANNIAPTAHAGADKTITLPTNSVSLVGSGNDSDGTIASYAWTKISGAAAAIANATSATTNVTGLVQGTYQFELKVTDNNGATGKDTMQVTVLSDTASTSVVKANIAPTANAGADKTITLPTNSVSLVGSGNDSDGTIASYAWTKISGAAATIANATSATTNVTGLVQGTYQFELKVTDNNGATGKDTMQVTVLSDTANTSVVKANIAPTANAGADKTITLPTNSVSLVGSGNDSDGTIASYAWTKISGAAATIANATSATTNVTGLVQGTYQFELKVTDNNGATGKDTMQVTVLSDTASTSVVKANIAPTANAGADKTITLPTNSVSLVGSGNDSDGTIASYAWTKISGAAAAIANATSATTNVTGLVQGSYQFELKVTDNNGATGKDTMQVTVLSDTASTSVVKANTAPTAHAGADKTITLPTNSVSLIGSGKDSVGTITSYAWSKISGPTTFKMSNSSSATVNVNGLVQGIYQFELKVTDNNGAIGKDTVQVTVLAANNIAPTANAGPDKTVILPANSVILAGMGSDVDGTIASYSWTKVSGPSTFSIANSSSATVNVTGLIQGTYRFELKVTDNKGDVGKDTVQVNVISDTASSSSSKQNLAPTANAGSDKTIYLPTSSVTLSGTGADADGTIASYSWTKISGPSATIANASSATTNVTGLTLGTYQFELKVTDDKGATGKDTVQVKILNDTTVSSPVQQNIAPTANAGTDITTVSSIQFITINGSGTDPDGQIKSYSWTQISGPSTAALSGANSATVKIHNLIEGTYQFELKVTDDKGAVGRDTVNVTVALERTSTQNVVVTTSTINVYPNPVHDVATVSITTPQVNTNVMLTISDINGKTVYTTQFVATSTSIQQQINMGNLIKGTYFITVYFDGMQQQSVKVIRL